MHIHRLLGAAPHANCDLHLVMNSFDLRIHISDLPSVDHADFVFIASSTDWLWSICSMASIIKNKYLLGKYLNTWTLNMTWTHINIRTKGIKRQNNAKKLSNKFPNYLLQWFKLTGEKETYKWQDDDKWASVPSTGGRPHQNYPALKNSHKQKTVSGKSGRLARQVKKIGIGIIDWCILIGREGIILVVIKGRMTFSVNREPPSPGIAIMATERKLISVAKFLFNYKNYWAKASNWYACYSVSPGTCDTIYLRCTFSFLSHAANVINSMSWASRRSNHCIK